MLENLFDEFTDLESFLNPRAWVEGSYKIGSVRSSFRPPVPPSVLPSVRKFYQNWLISFSWNLACIRVPYIVMCDRTGFFWKNLHRVKNGQKWPKNRVFGLFKKITSLVLSGIWVKLKFLWFINILWKLHAWEKSGSQVIAKNGSWPMRFQYSLIVNISLID